MTHPEVSAMPVAYQRGARELQHARHTADELRRLVNGCAELNLRATTLARPGMLRVLEVVEVLERHADELGVDLERLARTVDQQRRQEVPNA